MSNRSEMPDRRQLMKTALTATGAAALACAGVNAGEATAAKPSINFKNADFLDAKGQFVPDKAKDAIEALCRYHGYPMFPKFRENLWLSDYGLGKFAEVGLAAYLFVNNVKDQYMMLDIFILPNQMLPEHWHVEGEGNPAKREGWLVRWGLSHIVGTGDENLPKQVNVPKSHMDGKVTVKHEVAATPGMFVPLSEVGTRHWQYGGPEGAIVTEVANVHTNTAVRHSDPAMNKFFLEH